MTNHTIIVPVGEIPENADELLAIVPRTADGLTFKHVVEHTKPETYLSFVDEADVRTSHWHIKPDDVVLDIGCAFGSYVLPALAAGAAHVLAVTPDVGEITFLLRNLRANGWESRCTLIGHGLYDRQGFLQVFPGSKPEQFSETLPAEALVDDGSCFAVDTLDNLMSKLVLPRLDWIKLDVEGCEARVLRQGLATLAKYRPQLLIENHLFKDQTLVDQIREILLPFGYIEAGGRRNDCYDDAGVFQFTSVVYLHFAPEPL